MLDTEGKIESLRDMSLKEYGFKREAGRGGLSFVEKLHSLSEEVLDMM
jgi:hypothetical protein